MITDEMVMKALVASDKTRRHLDPSGKQRMRAALEAVEADIAQTAILKAYQSNAVVPWGKVYELLQAARAIGLEDAAQLCERGIRPFPEIANAIRALKTEIK